MLIQFAVGYIKQTILPYLEKEYSKHTDIFIQPAYLSGGQEPVVFFGFCVCIAQIFLFSKYVLVALLKKPIEGERQL